MSFLDNSLSRGWNGRNGSGENSFLTSTRVDGDDLNLSLSVLERSTGGGGLGGGGGGGRGHHHSRIGPTSSGRGRSSGNLTTRGGRGGGGVYGNGTGHGGGRGSNRLKGQSRVLTQVGRNVGKLRWLQDTQEPLLIPDLHATEYFVVGSDAQVPSNDVSLWRLSMREGDGDGALVPEMKQLCQSPVNGNVTDIVSLSVNSFVLTTSKGNLYVCHCSVDENNKSILNGFETMTSPTQKHRFKSGNMLCPATGVAANVDSIVSVGEDGTILQFSRKTVELVKSFEMADPLSLSVVKFINRHEIVTGNTGGQVKIWDLRTSGIPCATLDHLGELSGTSAIAQHPTQTHSLFVGYVSGGLEVWDLRRISTRSSDPVATLPKLGSTVSELYFHGINPDNFFTCSQDGKLTIWFPAENENDEPMDIVQGNEFGLDMNLEFMRQGLDGKTLYSSPFPLNSMDFSKHNRLISGGDSGVVLCTTLQNL